MPIPPLPEIDVCSRCGEGTSFELLDNRWVSVCCTAQPVNVDVEPDQLEGVEL